MKNLLIPFFSFLMVFGLFGQNNGLPVGSVAPDFTGVDGNGLTHNLYDYLEDGKYVLLDFSFITCPPCHLMVAGTNYVYANFGCNEKDLIVLGIDVVYTSDKYAIYWNYHQDKLNNGQWDGDPVVSTPRFPHICVDGGSKAISDAFGVWGNPCFILIGPDKKVVDGSVAGGHEKLFYGISLDHFATEESLRSYGLQPFLYGLGEQLYWETVKDKIGTGTSTQTPYFKFCDLGSPIGNQCNGLIPEDPKVVVSGNDIVASWTGDNACGSYSYGVSGHFDGSIEHTTSNSVTIKNLKPGPHTFYVHCDCNVLFECAEIDFVIEQPVISDFTGGNCAGACQYTLKLNRPGAGSGAEAFDWAQSGWGVEVKIGQTTGNFGLKEDEFSHTFDLFGCKNDSIKVSVWGNEMANNIWYELNGSLGEYLYSGSAAEYWPPNSNNPGEQEVFSSKVSCFVLSADDPAVLKKPVLSVFPNPSGGQFEVAVSKTEGQPIELFLTDLTGRLIKKETLPAGFFTGKTWTAEAAPGIYFLKMQTGHFTETVKILVNGQ